MSHLKTVRFLEILSNKSSVMLIVKTTWCNWIYSENYSILFYSQGVADDGAIQSGGIYKKKEIIMPCLNG